MASRWQQDYIECCPQARVCGRDHSFQSGRRVPLALETHFSVACEKSQSTVGLCLFLVSKIAAAAMIADRPRGKLRLVRTRDEVLAEVGVLEWKFERLG